MHSFKKNLFAFQNDYHYTRSDILELSGLSEKELHDLEVSECCWKGFKKFCINLDIDYSSIFLDSGFYQQDLYKQFESYPDAVKISTSRLLIKRLCAHLSEDKVKEILREAFTDKAPIFTGRLLSGASHLVTERHLIDLEIALKGLIPKAEFKAELGMIMYSLIPNYNFALIRQLKQLSYIDIYKSRCLPDITRSTIANWGNSKCAPIPSNYLKVLSEYFAVSEKEFATTLMAKENITLETAPKFSSNAMLDPISNDTPSNSTEIQKDLDKGMILPGSGTDFQNEPDHNDNKDVHSRCLLKSKSLTTQADSNSSLLHVNVDQESLLKMYGKLSREAKLKVNQLVLDLFLTQL